MDDSRVFRSIASVKLFEGPTLTQVDFNSGHFGQGQNNGG